MIKIKDVRERITTINLDKCKLRLNDYLYRWIIQLNLRDLSLKHVKTQIEIDLPNLESLEITLTNKSCVPCFPDNYKIRKLIIDDRTGKIEPILKLLRKFVDVECLEIRRALISVDVYSEIKKYPLVALTLIHYLDVLEHEVNILKDIPTLTILTVIDREENKQEILKGVSRHFHDHEEHQLFELNYLVLNNKNEKEREKDKKYGLEVITFPNDYDYRLLRKVGLYFQSDQEYDGDEFINLYYYFPQNFDLTFVELRCRGSTLQHVEWIQTLFNCIKIKNRNVDFIHIKKKDVRFSYTFN